MKWYDVRGVAEKLRPISVIIGGRGIGKTYSSLLYSLGHTPFIYMRNTDTQMQESCSAFGNPFKRINKDTGSEIYMEGEKKHYMIYKRVDDSESDLIGYGVALSTFENLRGVDLSDVKLVIFDEFIERRTLNFDQFSAFANFYETVNRNRELLGEEPLKCILLSNAQRLGNPILSGYGLIDVIMGMMERGERQKVTPNFFIDIPESEVSKAKRATVNYRLTQGTDFYNEAVNNQFARDSFARIVKRNILEYVPLCAIDDIYIYKHKSNGRIYVCKTKSNKIDTYTSKDNMDTFLVLYRKMFLMCHVADQIEYDSYSVKMKFQKLIGIDR